MALGALALSASQSLTVGYLSAESKNLIELVGVGVEAESSWALFKIAHETTLANLGDVVAERWKLTRVNRQCVIVEDAKERRPAEVCLSGATYKAAPLLNEATPTGLGDFNGPIGGGLLRELSSLQASWLGPTGSGHAIETEDAGFRVDRIDRNSFLASIGIQAGDVLGQINGIRIIKGDEFTSAATNIQGDVLEVSYQRDGQGRSTAIRLSDELLAVLKAARDQAK
jgi:membrane-associated protease RseP (regulator of RpoE activity)